MQALCKLIKALYPYTSIVPLYKHCALIQALCPYTSIIPLYKLYILIQALLDSEASPLQEVG